MLGDLFNPLFEARQLSQTHTRKLSKTFSMWVDSIQWTEIAFTKHYKSCLNGPLINISARLAGSPIGEIY